jgi:hypothetical protein
MDDALLQESGAVPGFVAKRHEVIVGAERGPVGLPTHRDEEPGPWLVTDTVRMRPSASPSVAERNWAAAVRLNPISVISTGPSSSTQ